MSSPIDPEPKWGDGPNRGDAPGENRAADAGEELEQDEEGGGGATKTASKGINPVQHSE